MRRGVLTNNCTVLHKRGETILYLIRGLQWLSNLDFARAVLWAPGSYRYRYLRWPKTSQSQNRPGEISADNDHVLTFFHKGHLPTLDTAYIISVSICNIYCLSLPRATQPGLWPYLGSAQSSPGSFCRIISCRFGCEPRRGDKLLQTPKQAKI